MRSIGNVSTLRSFQKTEFCSHSPSISSTSNIVHHEFLDEEINTAEIKRVIAKLQTPGWEGLPPPLFKLFDAKLIHFLTDIFNAVFDSGEFPQCWARGCIKVIRKRGSMSDPQ